MTRLKEMTDHIRKRIKAEGIKARVHMNGKQITVSVPAYEVNFTDEEQRKIRFIAVCNKLTLVRGMAIDVERMTDPKQMDFFLPA